KKMYAYPISANWEVPWYQCEHVEGVVRARTEELIIRSGTRKSDRSARAVSHHPAAPREQKVTTPTH
ncbi:hypothetical protein PISMIDRAFT_685594, partial [Pisolithus microcarpus 441]